MENQQPYDLDTNEIRKDVEEYLSEPINIINNQLEKTEILYNKVEKVYDDIQNNANMGSIKTLSEVASTLSNIRKTGLDAADKLFKSKAHVLELEIQFKKTKVDEEKTADSAALIAQIENIVNSNDNYKDIIRDKSNQTITQETKEAFDKLIEERISSGDLKLTNNDKMSLEKFKSKSEIEVKNE